MMIFTGCNGVWGDLGFGIWGSEFGLRDEAFKFTRDSFGKYSGNWDVWGLLRRFNERRV